MPNTGVSPPMAPVEHGPRGDLPLRLDPARVGEQVRGGVPRHARAVIGAQIDPPVRDILVVRTLRRCFLCV